MPVSNVKSPVICHLQAPTVGIRLQGILIDNFLCEVHRFVGSGLNLLENVDASCKYLYTAFEVGGIFAPLRLPFARLRKIGNARCPALLGEGLRALSMLLPPARGFDLQGQPHLVRVRYVLSTVDRRHCHIRDAVQDCAKGRQLSGLKIDQYCKTRLLSQR